MSTPRIDADLLGRFLTDEERTYPEVKKLIGRLVLSYESGYYHYRLLKPTLIHEAAHAVYAENFGCFNVRIELPAVEMRNGKPSIVDARVRYLCPYSVSAEQCLKIALAGPVAEEILCPDLLKKEAMKEVRDNDLESGKANYLEGGGLEANFKDDCLRVTVEIIEELNDQTLQNRIYDSAEKFRGLFPPSISVR